MRLTSMITRRDKLAGAAGLAVLAVLAAACSGGGQPGSVPGGVPGTASAAAGRGPAITITPANGASAADPSAGITVTTASGTLTSVSVRAGSATVPGSFAAARRSWHSSWALSVSSTYKVTATATEPGSGSKTVTSTFRTLAPSRTFRTEIFEGYGQKYGVGMPVILTFSEPITDKAAVERSLELTTSKPVVGAWYWDGDQTLDFRPRDYWPANTTVTFTGHLDGVEGAPGHVRRPHPHSDI